MFIKNIVLDGFKSYGRRTDILGFDRHFTAVTGLNGSGKSNIVDAICFVMGISNVGQMRASNWSELIYKNGPAHASSCSATLYFDNSDKTQQPSGYEACEEIVVSRLCNRNGQNKVTINGRTVKPKQVRTFFRSIKMNIDKPNFLIMQGSITRVLTMKPNEILSMVQEAAGIGIYESQRTATTKLLEKKDSKLRHTQALLMEDIQPKIDKLLQDRTAFDRYQSLCRELEFLTGVSISYQYKTQEECAAQLEAQIDELTDQIRKQHRTIEENKTDIKRIESISRKLQKRIDLQADDELKTYRDRLENKRKQAAIFSGKCQAAQSKISDAQGELMTLKKCLEDDIKALRQKENEMALKRPIFDALQQAHSRDECAYEAAQRRYDAITQGLSVDEDGNTCSLQDQLIAVNKQLSEARTEVIVSKEELTHCRKILLKKEAETGLPDEIYVTEMTLHERLEAEAAKITAKFRRSRYKHGDYERKQEYKTELELQKRDLKRQLRKWGADRYELQYSDPERSFDRTKVHGMVGKLFSVRDKRYSLALSIAAGRSIFSYVTDDEITSRKILDKGQLKEPAGFIPMNKLYYEETSKDLIKVAQNLVGKDNVQPALSLVEYDPRFGAVMKLIFGQTLICRDMDVVTQLRNNETIKCQMVTLDGGIVEADDLTTGESTPKGENTLDQLMEIKHIEEQLKRCRSEILRTDKELKSLGKLARSFNPLKERLDQIGQEMDACKSRLAHTYYKQREDEIESLKSNISLLEQKIRDGVEKEKALLSKARNIEISLGNAEEYRELELKAAFESMKSAQQKAAVSRDTWKEREAEFETLLLDIEGLNFEVAEATQKCEAQENKIRSMEARLAKLYQQCAKETEKIAALERYLKKKEESQNQQLKNFLKKKQNCETQNQELAMAIKLKNLELKNLKKDRVAVKVELKQLEEKYPWILREKESFGSSNTRYDYDAVDPVEAKTKIEMLQKQQKKMERKINPAVMTMIESQIEQMETLKHQNEIVAGHKRKLVNFIETWDTRKREKVREAWQAVNKNFSSIFSVLLPGAKAKLTAVEEHNEIAGLQIMVAFNNMWKESLSELSRGQRSLVVLALLLAMLTFSPAPLYVLDEIDASLDMSHTQHIGDIFQAYFPTSQFIVISLKEEMFKNANVLFQTKFQDGASVIMRSAKRAQGGQ